LPGQLNNAYAVFLIERSARRWTPPHVVLSISCLMTMAEIIITLSIQPIPPSHRWMHSMPTIYIFVLIDVMWLVKIYIGWWSWSRAEPAHKPCLQYCYFVTRIVLRELCFARTKRGAQSSLPPPTANIWRSQETPATEPTCILSLSQIRRCFSAIVLTNP
jgi:hypothetical protein